MNIKNAKKTFEALEKNNHAQHLVQQQHAWICSGIIGCDVVLLLFVDSCLNVGLYRMFALCLLLLWIGLNGLNRLSLFGRTVLTPCSVQPYLNDMPVESTNLVGNTMLWHFGLYIYIYCHVLSARWFNHLQFIENYTVVLDVVNLIHWLLMVWRKGIEY